MALSTQINMKVHYFLPSDKMAQEIWWGRSYVLVIRFWLSHEVNCPFRWHSLIELLWVSPPPDPCCLPSPHRQSVLVLGKVKMAGPSPLWLGDGTKPHCLPAQQLISREMLVWQGKLILFTRRHDTHAATDGGREPEELVCCSRSDLFPRVNSRNIPYRECISPPSPSLWFSIILWMYQDYLPLSLLGGYHVAFCTLGILQRHP